MKDKCECGRDAKRYITVTDEHGTLLDCVGLCGPCFNNRFHQDSLTDLGLIIGAMETE